MEASSEDASWTPEPAAALSISTTEHFVLQAARAATISESTGRAGMFLSALSGGLTGGGVVAVAALVALTEYQRAAWIRTDSAHSERVGESS